ncbi:MAG: type II toxin-antitoxin system RelE/ParE family toxin [Bryobacterales bacterium]|nr:type II toxin-antitoxin system RelE/ParE family toxin [Bryobacterales bacterium]MBV9402006.1 type II toxin-antitoxin system RelE/ParE family toxin [Bryobacterales bacterium]
MRIRWTHPALNDLKSISHRIEQQRNVATANRVCRHIYDSIQSLRRHPHIGRPGTEEGTRELVVSKSPYIVIYRLHSDVFTFSVSGTALRTGVNPSGHLFMPLGCGGHCSHARHLNREAGDKRVYRWIVGRGGSSHCRSLSSTISGDRTRSGLPGHMLPATAGDLD